MSSSDLADRARSGDFSLALELTALDDETRAAVAIRSGGKQLTFGELDARAAACAKALIASGIGPADRVLVLVQNSVEVFDLLYGCARIGAVLVPINWRLADAELLAVARDSTAVGVVVAGEFADRLPLLADAGVGDRVRLVIGADSGESSAYENWLWSASDADDVVPSNDITADHRVVLQIYTSGTSGLPKGVLLTNANVAAKVANARTIWGMDRTSVSLLATPLFHIAALSWGLVSISARATMIIASSASPRILLDHLSGDRVSHTFLVPAILGRLSDEVRPDDDFGALQRIVYGASPITPAVQRAASAVFGKTLFQLYGLTETMGGVTELSADDHEQGVGHDHLLRSAGRPYPWVDVQIRDGAGVPLAVGETGEVWTRSAQNCAGYFNRPVETAELLGEGNWLRTGDAGHVDPDGYLFITDRVKDMIVSGGENVYPIELESVLREHPLVADVAVIGLPDDRWGETVTAVVVARSPLQDNELIEWTQGRIAGYKRPRRVIVLDELPRNASGKVLKRELRKQFSTAI